MSVTLLTGGARSGKSTLAVKLAAPDAPVIFVATAMAGVGMDERIARHRSERPKEWSTLEEPVDLVSALAPIDPGATLLLDCLTLWVSNLMAQDRDDPAIEAEADELSAALAARPGTTIVVTNEVGSGVHPDSALGIRFQDLLGRVNSIVAARADRVLLCVAGRALEIAPVEQLS